MAEAEFSEAAGARALGQQAFVRLGLPSLADSPIPGLERAKRKLHCVF